jgi:hypothetical protein
MTLLFRLAEWHALAKLRMHTEHTLNHLNQSTITIGRELRSFQAWTRDFNTVDLPSETAARERRRRKKATLEKANNSSSPSQDHPVSSRSEKAPARSKVKLFNLLIYKFHALGDYVQTIKLFGTTDSYSTQVVSENPFIHRGSISYKVFAQGELAHRLVKRFYQRTNKKDAIRQITRHERRYVRLRRAREAAASPRRRQAHHVSFSENDALPPSEADRHHHMSDSKNFPHHLLSFVQQPPHDPAKKVYLFTTILNAHAYLYTHSELHSKTQRPHLISSSWSEV